MRFGLPRSEATNVVRCWCSVATRWDAVGHLRADYLDHSRDSTEVSLGSDAGLAHDSVANFDNVFLLARSPLSRLVGRADGTQMSAACTASAIAAGCHRTEPGERYNSRIVSPFRGAGGRPFRTATLS